MRKTRMIEIGRRVATSLVEAERDVDVAMQSAARLIDNMLEARMVVGAPVAAGHAALRHVAGAVAQLVVVRTSLVDSHRELAELQDTLPVIREMGMGDESPCPSPSAKVADLRVVA